MAKIYDFGANTNNICANERKSLAWPVAIWSCYIPESATQKLNILEHLILQLVSQGFTAPREVLCSQVGFNKDLVDAAIEACVDNDYFDRRYKELTLSSCGQNILNTFNNPYVSDMEIAQKNKKIYMIQDLVTKNVVPVFDIEKLPQFFIEDENALVIKYENFIGAKPRSASVKIAMREWARLCADTTNGQDVSGNNSIDCSTQPKVSEEIDGDIPFEDELNWKEFQEDESVIEKVTTLAEKEADDKEKKAVDDVEKLTIFDDKPEVYYARGYIAINRNAPDEALIISPFGERLDNWFRRVINRLRICDREFEEEIQLFLMIKRDELKGTLAFGNDLDIALFSDYPFICNNPEYKAVKATIRRLTVSRNRFMHGEDDTINFAQALRTAYEASLRLVVKKNPSLFKAGKIEYKEYKKKLKMLVNTYSFFDCDIYREYSGPYIYKNMTSANEKDGYATAFIALFMMDAWNNKNGHSMEMLRNLPSLPILIKERTSNLKKYNKKGEGIIASHGGDAIAELKFSETKAKKQYAEFENIFRSIYNRFMEV